MIPTVLASSSYPTQFPLLKSWLCTPSLASQIFLKIEKAWPTASSPAAVLFAVGVLSAITPCSVQEATSMLSIPVPALPTALRQSALFRSAGLTFVADLTILLGGLWVTVRIAAISVL